MNSSNEILAELTSISPLLARMEKINVFSVPDGYFNTLPTTVLSNLNQPFISSLDSFSKNNLNEIPEGYFENLSGSILNKIKQQEFITGVDFESTLDSVKNKNVFQTPKGYFENLPDTILNNIKQQAISPQDELKNLSSTLHSIKNKNVFEVPQGYFDTVSSFVLTKVTRKPAKVVVMYKRKAFFKYASAAMIACIISLGVYKFANKPTTHTSNTIALASLDPAIQTGIKMNDKQFNQALDTLSDDAIANYLDKNGNYSDMSELSSDIDDNSLPNADQYLLDDKTLDNYLSNNNLNQKDN